VSKNLRLHRAGDGPGGITPRAVKLFEKMRRLPCVCKPRDWGQDQYYKWPGPCFHCKERGRLKYEIHRELRLYPWETAVEDPEAGSPYPVGSWAYENDEPNLEAQARWRALEQAAREMRRARRAAKAAANSPSDVA